jgi:nitroreductase
MEFDEVIRSRRSIRGFLDTPVPRALIAEVLELAMRAPTSMNTQPWHFHVVAGEVLDRIRAGNVERNLAGVPHSREFRLGPEYAGAHRERQVEIAKQRFGAMGIARDDRQARQDWILRGFRQFDAPASIIVTYDRALHGSDIPPSTAAASSTAWSTRRGRAGWAASSTARASCSRRWSAPRRGPRRTR